MLNINLGDLIETIDIGDQVVCDICNTDYTNDNISKGGILFGSKAVCPICAPRMEQNIIKYHEQEFIKGRCPVDVTFREWCLGLRNGQNTVKIYNLNKDND